ncbi:hypothetical protein V8C43DRAFT_275391 [Trichoderma afarasin]
MASEMSPTQLARPRPPSLPQTFPQFNESEIRFLHPGYEYDDSSHPATRLWTPLGQKICMGRRDPLLQRQMLSRMCEKQSNRGGRS